MYRDKIVITEKMVYINTCLIQIVMANKDRNLPYLADIMSEKNGRWCCLMLVYGNHWICIYSIFKYKIEYQNPYEINRDKDVSKLVNLLFGEEAHLYKINQVYFMKKEDGYSCGVYCCYFMKSLIYNVTPTEFDIEIFREEIYEVITKK